MAIIRTTNGHTYKVSEQDLAAAMKEEEKWAGKLREALVGGAAYNERQHNQLAEEMEAIESKLGNYAGGTIFDHVRSIFDDAVTRGFQHDLHFPQLIAQYTRYGFGNPPEQWVPPPDVQSRDGTPVLPPLPSPRRPTTRSSQQPLAHGMPAVKVTAAKKGKSNEKPAVREEMSTAVKNDTASASGKQTHGWGDSNEEEAVREGPPKRTPRVTWKNEVEGSLRDVGDENTPGPSRQNTNNKDERSKSVFLYTIGDTSDRDEIEQRPPNVHSSAIRYYPGCSRCESSGGACWLLKKHNTKPACYSCRSARAKCDINGQIIDSDDKVKTPLARKTKQRRKGQIPEDSKALTTYDASYLPADVVAKLDNYERQAMEIRALREEFIEMSQLALNIERRLITMGSHLSDRMLGIWEAVNQKTAVISQEVKGIRRGLEEHDRRFGVIRDFTDHTKLFLGKAKDCRHHLRAEDVIDETSLEPQEVDEEERDVVEPLVERAARPMLRPRSAAVTTSRIMPYPVVSGPSHLPLVPLRNASRKRSTSLVAPHADGSNAKRQRTE